MKKWIPIFAIILMIFCVLSFSSCKKENVDDKSHLEFALKADGTYEVKSCTFTEEINNFSEEWQSIAESIVIPATYNGKPVTSIGKEVFKNRRFIKRIKHSRTLL